MLGTGASTMPKAKINPTAATLLGFLFDGPKTGWDLIQVIETTVGHCWNTTRSQVYRELHSLHDLGFVSRGEAGRRDRVPYTITDEGRAGFLDWINQPPGPQLVRIPFLLSLFFGKHIERERLERFLRAERIEHETRLEHLRGLADAARASREAGHPNQPRTEMLALLYGLSYEEAIAKWFEQLPTLMDELDWDEPIPGFNAPEKKTAPRKAKARSAARR